jgi:hypothetical protein
VGTTRECVSLEAGSGAADSPSIAAKYGLPPNRGDVLGDQLGEPAFLLLRFSRPEFDDHVRHGWFLTSTAISGSSAAATEPAARGGQSWPVDVVGPTSLVPLNVTTTA